MLLWITIQYFVSQSFLQMRGLPYYVAGNGFFPSKFTFHDCKEEKQHRFQLLSKQSINVHPVYRKRVIRNQRILKFKERAEDFHHPRTNTFALWQIFFYLLYITVLTPPSSPFCFCFFFLIISFSISFFYEPYFSRMDFSRFFNLFCNCK